MFPTWSSSFTFYLPSLFDRRNLSEVQSITMMEEHFHKTLLSSGFKEYFELYLAINEFENKAFGDTELCRRSYFCSSAPLQANETMQQGNFK